MVNTSMTSARTFAELKHHDDFPSLTGLERGGHRLEPLVMRRSPNRVFA